MRLACSHVNEFNNRNKLLTSELLKQGHRYLKRHEAFSTFYYPQSRVDCQIQYLLKDSSVRSCNLWRFVHKFKRIVGNPNFSDQFQKILQRYKRVGYNMDIMRCLHAWL